MVGTKNKKKFRYGVSVEDIIVLLDRKDVSSQALKGKNFCYFILSWVHSRVGTQSILAERMVECICVCVLIHSTDIYWEPMTHQAQF